MVAPVAAQAVTPVAVAVAHEAPAEHAEGELGADGLPHPYHPPAAHDFGPAPKRNKLVEMWKTVGGGSLTLSIAIHAGILIVAGLVVFTSTR